MIDEGGEIGVCHKDDVAAVTTVAAIRTAAGHILLAAKAHTAVATRSRLDRDCHFVYEHGSRAGSATRTGAEFGLERLLHLPRNESAHVAIHASNLAHDG